MDIEGIKDKRFIVETKGGKKFNFQPGSYASVQEGVVVIRTPNGESDWGNTIYRTAAAFFKESVIAMYADGGLDADL